MRADARSEATDEMLMVRYQRGDRHAFEELVRRHERGLYNFVVRQLGPGALAEDLTQDAFLRVVQNAGEFKHEARFSTWLYTIARNLCIDQLRKLGHRRHASLDQPTGGDHDGPPLVERVADARPNADVERSAAMARVATTIERAIDALPDDQREVFLLREVANLPFKDIAEVTGAGENTVKSRMRYALDRLQSALAEYEEYARALR
ncbi:MAG: RNA polymerase sigma factor [Polyangiaceae bacterium]|nr:RNA polymerase sigma factor [Polyangiaceae bacterium]